MPPPLNKHLPAGCVATSSNCVIWNGPDLPCLNLCAGASITAVIHELATLLCNSAAGLVEVSSLDFACLVEATAHRPATLSALLQLLISKVCTVDQALQELAENPDGDPLTDDGRVRLPAWLQVENADHERVVSLDVPDYLKLLADTICTLLTDTRTALLAHQALVRRVSQVEETLHRLGLPAQGISLHLNCLVGSSADRVPLEEAFGLVETLVCDLNRSVGSHVDMLQAIGRQCLELGSSFQLNARTQPMSTLPGWVAEPLTVADALSNLWLTVCDLRTAVIKIGSIIRAGCADVLLDFAFVPATDGHSGVLTLYGHTILPSNFTSLPSSRLVISDGTTTLTVPVDVFLLTRTSTQRQTVLLQSASTADQLNLSAMLSFRLIADLLDDEQTSCSKEVTRQLRPLCDNQPVSAAGIVLTPTATGALVEWSAPLSLVPPLRYRVALTTQTEAEPVEIYVATVTGRAVVIPEGTLASNAPFGVVVRAIYDCAPASDTTVGLNTLPCNTRTVVAGLINRTNEVDQAASSPYLSVNGKIAPVLEGSSIVVVSDCTGRLLVEYALSQSDLITREHGELTLNGKPIGTVLRTVSGPGFQTATLELLNLSAATEYVLVFTVSTES